MNNPFRLRWLQGWTFQVVLMEGHVQVEALGFGFVAQRCYPGESPATDRLVLSEDRRRRLSTTPGCVAKTWRNPQVFHQPKTTLPPPIL